MDLLCRYTDTKIVCTKKTSEMICQFFDEDVLDRAIIVKENDTLSTGKHEFQFIMDAARPMQMVDTSHLMYCIVS